MFFFNFFLFQELENLLDIIQLLILALHHVKEKKSKNIWWTKIKQKGERNYSTFNSKICSRVETTLVLQISQTCHCSCSTSKRKTHQQSWFRNDISKPCSMTKNIIGSNFGGNISWAFKVLKRKENWFFFWQMMSRIGQRWRTYWVWWKRSNVNMVV